MSGLSYILTVQDEDGTTSALGPYTAERAEELRVRLALAFPHARVTRLALLNMSPLMGRP